MGHAAMARTSLASSPVDHLSGQGKPDSISDCPHVHGKIQVMAKVVGTTVPKVPSSTRSCPRCGYSSNDVEIHPRKVRRHLPKQVPRVSRGS
ncbi:hypothetical protein H257_17590 [Aphanomyces astaci]|uniref:Uncharacterized protein n=1 Tax=Aphanomyces astaci TaxID=112090 RepID=W4FGB1_APHAT|nr:hypothetical protein H257_17590 [Aphanomyces astaci]ETV65778.1 hypothetical protein H257_17590 [Aphanomyces astaci]|eukprot:XP_009844753.1 hypothetical protein H257_17590 [Aphanomyces astaci]